jgi:hypothetical protein
MLGRTLSLSLRYLFMPLLRLTPSMAAQQISKQTRMPLYGSFATLKRTDSEDDLEHIHETDRAICKNDPMGTINRYPFDQIPTSLVRTP